MDSDFWTSRLAAAKRQYTLQHHHQSSHLGEYLHIRSGFFFFFLLLFFKALVFWVSHFSMFFVLFCFVGVGFRSVGYRWFWGGGRGQTRFPMSVLLRGLRYRVTVFASRRRALVRIQSHCTCFFTYTLMFVLFVLVCMCGLWERVKWFCFPYLFNVGGFWSLLLKLCMPILIHCRTNISLLSLSASFCIDVLQILTRFLFCFFIHPSKRKGKKKKKVFFFF